MSEVHKRWMVFGGNNYYPYGGIEDLIDVCYTKIEVREIINRKKNNFLNTQETRCDWYNIYDIDNHKTYTKAEFIEKFGDL